MNKTDIRIAITGCLLVVVSIGTTRAFTVYQKILVDYYNSSETTVASISTLYMVGVSASGTTTGYIFPRFGLRKPFVFSGIVSSAIWVYVGYTLPSKNPLIFQLCAMPIGCCMGLLFPGALTCARVHSSKAHMGAVMTLIGGGSSIGVLVLPSCYQFFIDHFGDEGDKGNGIQASIYFIAVYNVLVVFLAFATLETKVDQEEKTTGTETEKSRIYEKKDTIQLQNSNETEDLKPQQPKNNTPTSETAQTKPKFFSIKLWKQPTYVLFIIGKLLFLNGYTGISQYIDPVLSSIGFEKITVKFLLMALGIIECISRFFHAFCLVDKFDRIITMGILYTGDGIFFMTFLTALIFPDYKWPIIATCLVLAGFCNSGFGGLMQACMVDITSASNYTTAFSMQMLTSGVGLASGPYFCGKLVDLVNEGNENDKQYWPAFVFAPCAMLAAGILTIPLKLQHMREQKLNQRVEVEVMAIK